MKKHFSEDKLGFRIELILGNSLLFLFLHSVIATAQIPINGFCRFQQFSTSQNQSKISAVDYNNDGWRDLLVYNQIDKKYFVQQWNKNELQKPIERNLQISVFNLQSMGSDDASGKRFAFISRKNREAGISTISKNGLLNIKFRFKFDSYPSHLDVGDIDKKNKSVILVSGSSFDGLSILAEEKNKLVEKKIDNKNLYSFSKFIDLDFDGYLDIAAFNLLKNSLVFFYNDQSGSFTETRSIGFNKSVSEPNFFDINSDGFSDLIYVSDNQFEVLLGDSVSSFDKKISIFSRETPSKYTVLDFNGDGYNDIAYYNSVSGNLYIIYARSTNKFYPPVIYFQKDGLVDLISFIDRGGKKIFTLDKYGNVYIINKLLHEDESSIPLTIKPFLVETFDLFNNKRSDLFFVDSENLRVVFLTSKKQLFDTFHEYKISGTYTNVVVDDLRRDVKTFFFFSKDKNVIELLRVDFPRMEFSKRILYSKGGIKDLKITSDRVKDRQTILVLSQREGKLILESFDFRDFRYLSSGADEIATNIIDASLLLDVYKEIFYTKQEYEFFSLYNSTYHKKVLVTEEISKVSFNILKNGSALVKSFEDKDINENISLGWFDTAMGSEVILYNRKRVHKISLKDFKATKGSISYSDGDKENSIFLYDGVNGKMKKIMIDVASRKYETKDLFELKNINTYIVDRLNNKKEYLIYSDSTDNLIKLKAIK